LVWDVDLSPVWKFLKERPDSKDLFGHFPDLATHSKANVGRLAASSFCERVNSAGKIVFGKGNLKMKSEKIEERVMLRMNRKWVAHMRRYYPECNSGRILDLIKRSHDALESLYEPAAVSEEWAQVQY
jgi:hypothetical protein